MKERVDLLCDKAYINGAWVLARGGTVFPVTNPATGEQILSVPDMSGPDTEAAIAAAHETFVSPEWKALTCKERSSMLKRLFEAVVDNKDELATIMTKEMGKPLAESLGEIGYASAFLEWYAEEAKRIDGNMLVAPNRPSLRVMTIRQPVGVVGIITPWNFPLAMITRKLGAALAAGCTMVIKPAENTPLVCLALAKLADNIGIPKGAINIVTGRKVNASEIGKTMCESPLVSKISFTGSTAVGKILLAQSASTVKKVSMELGGNAPLIVFDSADVAKAVTGAMAKFRNCGQTCICPNRIFVQSGIFDQFCEAFASEIKKLKMGNGLDPGVTQGPLVNEAAIAKVTRHVEDALSQGARCILGGAPDPTLGANFFQPTLLVDVPVDSIFSREETFGPVAPLIKFETEEEVIRLANSVRVGLAGYVFSSDTSQIFRVSEALEVGMVGANEAFFSSEFIPFGGVKESGMGREGSIYGIDDYMELKTITLGV